MKAYDLDSLISGSTLIQIIRTNNWKIINLVEAKIKDEIRAQFWDEGWSRNPVRLEIINNI